MVRGWSSFDMVARSGGCGGQIASFGLVLRSLWGLPLAAATTTLRLARGLADLPKSMSLVFVFNTRLYIVFLLENVTKLLFCNISGCYK